MEITEGQRRFGMCIISDSEAWEIAEPTRNLKEMKLEGNDWPVRT